jgi:hypothetical protein
VPLLDATEASRWPGCDVFKSPGGLSFAYVPLSDEGKYKLAASCTPRGNGKTFNWQTMKRYHHEFEEQRGHFRPNDQGHDAGS